MRQAYTETDASTISPEANAMTRERAARMGSSGPFPTPSLKPTIMFPGYDGGMEWGGGAADPQGTYYVNINEIPWTYQLIPTRRADGSALSLGERGYLTQCASCHGLEKKGEPASGFPPLVDLHTKPRDYANGIVERGGPGRMPAFGQDLPEGQRRAILDHLYGVEQPEPAGRGGEGAGRGGRGAAAPYAFTGFQRMFDRERYPAIKPPWGTLNAVDLNTGEIKWKVPLGEYPELTKRGIPPTGTENYGGPVVTASGLIFIGATADETIRAFDKDTGKILWQAALPFGGNATPSVYMAGGRQYLVISAGGAKSGRPSGGSIVAFALPR
jgi:quinoprotein glucose dehydrogenase